MEEQKYIEYEGSAATGKYGVGISSLLSATLIAMSLFV